MNKRHAFVGFILFLCIVKENYACFEGWNLNRGRCYYFSSFKTDFFTALSFCRVYGGMLVEIDNQNEYLALRELGSGRRNDMYWIGLTDLFGENIWMKATTMKRQNFKLWEKRIPKNGRGNQHCVTMGFVRRLPFGVWNYDNCESKRQFVCRK